MAKKAESNTEYKVAGWKNLALWKRHETTDKEHTKKLPGGAGLTTVDAQWQCLQATEEWGPYGLRWGIRDIHWTKIETDTGVSIVMEGVLYYPGPAENFEGQVHVQADMPFHHNRNVFKMLRTQLQSKALSLLGFSADVYMGRYDDDFFTAVQEEASKERVCLDRALLKVSVARDQKDLDSIEKLAGLRLEEGVLGQGSVDQILQAVDARVKELNR